MTTFAIIASIVAIAAAYFLFFKRGKNNGSKPGRNHKNVDVE